jgi:hypothetical protein
MKVVGLGCALAICAWAQVSPNVPRFEDFPAAEVFRGEPAQPVLTTVEEQRYRTVIRRGVSMGWGAKDGTTGRELAAPGPNFARHYVIVTWGCGSPSLMKAIVDLKTGCVFPPLSYRLDSRLLVANICEADNAVGAARKCGAHYFVIGDKGLKLVYTHSEK